MQIRLISSLSKQQLEQAAELYCSAAWVSEEEDCSFINAAVSGSFLAAAAFADDGSLAGMGRVLSDGVSDAYIQDVVVHPEFRSQGIGGKIVAFLVAELEKRGVDWIALVGPSFGAEKQEKRSKCENVDMIMAELMAKKPISTTLEIQTDKLKNAFTKYPIKGLKGSKNANFYEFLTMGQVPYLVGSATLMAVFNAANKHFAPFAKEKASALGKKMALGVVFYGLAKELVNKGENLQWRNSHEAQYQAHGAGRLCVSVDLRLLADV